MKTRILILASVATLLGATALNFFDRYSSTLGSSYTSGGSSIVVASATGLPSGASNYYVIVKAENGNTEEVFKVTSRSGTTLTVTGAQAGTSASNHGSGATIIGSIMTAAAYAQLLTDAMPTWLSIQPDVPPASPGSLDDEFTDAAFNDNSKWTLFDHTTGGNATRAQTSGWFHMDHASNSAAEGIHAIMQTAPGTPWTVVVKLAAISVGSGASAWSYGLCMKDSGTGKYQLFKLQNSSGLALVVDNYSDIHTYASTQTTPVSTGNAPTTSPIWYKLQDTGTNFVWSYSPTGAYYYQLSSISRTSYLATPDRVGVCINPYAQEVDLQLDYFRQTQ